MTWLLHLLGVDDVSGRWYGFWSGFGSDLSELAIVGGLISLVRHKNCEVHRCWRLGRHVTSAGHSVCRKHHPDGHLTAGDVLAASQAMVPVEDVLGEHLRAIDGRVKAHCADVKEHVSTVADAQVRAGAGSNPAVTGLPADQPKADAPSAERVVPPAATRRRRGPGPA